MADDKTQIEDISVVNSGEDSQQPELEETRLVFYTCRHKVKKLICGRRGFFIKETHQFTIIK